MIKSNIIAECEKVDYKPLTLSYTFFKIADYKTDVVGYWLHEGKLYKDNIQLINIPVVRRDYLNCLIREAFRNGEKAVFYKNPYNEGVLVNKSEDGLILNCQSEVLKYQTHIIEKVEPTEAYIKELLRNTDGLTVYKTVDGKYLIEIYR